MSLGTKIVGRSPGDTLKQRVSIAGLRALRTLIQGVIASFGTGGAGLALLSVGYWEVVGVSIIGALITSLLSFLQNIMGFLPVDPSQKPTEQ